MITGYDTWKNSQPDEPDPVEKCDCCGRSLYVGDFISTIDGEKICDDCLNDYYRRML